MTKKPANPTADPVPTRVEICAGGHQVVIESPDPLNTVARKALDLWRQTNTGGAALGGGGGFGFAAGELAGDCIPPDLTLPDRLQPGGDDDRRQPTGQR